MIKNIQAKDRFQKAVKGNNFVTPEILYYGQKKSLVYELSTGDIMGHKLYGVAVVHKGEHSHELSRSFYSLKEAEDYIASL